LFAGLLFQYCSCGPTFCTSSCNTRPNQSFKADGFAAA
jgi:hypothetical protein